MPKPAVHAGFEQRWERWAIKSRKPFFCEDAKNGLRFVKHNGSSSILLKDRRVDRRPREKKKNRRQRQKFINNLEVSVEFLIFAAESLIKHKSTAEMNTQKMTQMIADYFKTQPVLKAWLFGSHAFSFLPT